MFRVLSNEETTQVKKWRAPNLGDPKGTLNPLAGMKTKMPHENEEVITDITNLRSVIQEASSNASSSNDDFSQPEQENDDSDGSHTSLTMSNSSADMLQQTYDEGYAAGVESSKSQADGLGNDALLSLLASLAQDKYQIDLDLEQEVVLLAKAIAKMVLRREVEIDDKVILEIVQSALTQMPMTNVAPTVVLHPDDLNAIENIQTSSIAATLKPDLEMRRGDCRIESGASILEAGIDALVDSISSSRREHTEHNPADVDPDSPVDTPITADD